MALDWSRSYFHLDISRNGWMAMVLWLSLVVRCDPHPSHAPADNHFDPHHHSGYGRSLYGKLPNSTAAIVFPDQKSHSAPPASLSVSGNRITSLNPNVSASSPLFAAATRLPQDNDNTSSSDLTSLNSKLHKEQGRPSSLFELEEENEKNHEEKRDFSKLVLKLDKDYTPREIADYIFSTGDEKGISQAISDMIQDGQIMTSKDDMIRFLEEVQKELSKMRNHFHEKAQRGSTFGNRDRDPTSTLHNTGRSIRIQRN